MSRPQRVLPAAASEQRRLVARDGAVGSFGAFSATAVFLAAAAGHVIGAGVRGGEVSAAVIIVWVLAASVALTVASFALFARQLSGSLPADDWAKFYARYVRVARWHGRAAR